MKTQIIRKLAAALSLVPLAQAKAERASLLQAGPGDYVLSIDGSYLSCGPADALRIRGFALQHPRSLRPRDGALSLSIGGRLAGAECHIIVEVEARSSLRLRVGPREAAPVDSFDTLSSLQPGARYRLEVNGQTLGRLVASEDGLRFVPVERDQ